MSNEIMSLGNLLLKNLIVIVIAVIVIDLIVMFIKQLLPKKSNGFKGEYKNIEDKTKDEKSDVVIQAVDLCLDYDKDLDEYSSFKEYLIKTVKGQKKGGKFRALNKISFEINRGDVVGVIGTNGAGKSSLLKVIAGAFHPTDGALFVDKSKVQILTLGSGFDEELTGKENVYLNGAVIGYEKKFISEHYDEIVEFAELEDFMDEKMKNYSSGMKSRLAFSIATAGDAPEILLIDEVLSVGDRLFSEKSGRKITEMIHGGSTVVLVSHSQGAIRENCNKVLWIEKGQFVAFGDTKEICDMYDRYDGKNVPVFE